MHLETFFFFWESINKFQEPVTGFHETKTVNTLVPDVFQLLEYLGLQDP